MDKAQLPDVAIIVPGHNAARTLEKCLSSLRKQDWPGDRLELIYVDDSSTDASVEIARRYADQIIPSAGAPRGPAAARNIGADKTSANVFVFIDSDITAPPHTIAALLDPLIKDPGLDAVFGSYDTEPAHKGVVSQYRNLFHHYTHQNSSEEASTFWAGCGAIRSNSFKRVGGFNAILYPKPMIEDIELGHRMRAAGMRIRLDKSVQVAHLKKWRLWNMLTSDLFCRGIPWTKLILRERGRSGEIGDLNLRLAAMLSIPLVWGAVLLSFFAYRFPVILLFILLLLLLCMLLNLRVFRFFRRVRGVAFAVATIPLNLLYHFFNGISVLGGLSSHVMAKLWNGAGETTPGKQNEFHVPPR